MPKIPTSLLPKTEKVAYIKRQGQTRDHHCHWPGCEEQVPPAKWGCYKHWMKLPKRLRDAIWAAFSPGQEINWSPSREYVKVAREVQEWIAVNHLARPCVACGGTGVSSKGNPCFPCLMNGRYQIVSGELVLVRNELGIVGSLDRRDRVIKRPDPPKLKQTALFGE